MERTEGLSADQTKFIERCVKAYRAALGRGERPAVERFLEQTQHGPLKRELLKALLRVDWDAQQQKGGKPAVDAYMTQYSADSESVADAYKQWSREQNPKPATTPGAAATVSMATPAVPASAPTASTAVTCYYLRHGVPIGPFTWPQLMQLARAGDLRPKDQVRIGGSGEWQEAGQINGLFASSTENKGKELRPGEMIRPDYMLLELIGRGGMGDVYKVFRTSLKREYALKIIRQDRFRTLSPEMKQDQVERFQKEMQTTARLKHDHIVAIHDTGEHCGLPFYTMDFVDTSLAQKLRHGPLEPRLAAELVAKAARGVHHAHGEGIIHRDIKPHNILLDKDKPLLADLGLAAALEVLQGKGSGEIAGTAAYMAPEQASGGTVDARTDVYGLGATLYHLVTSRPPHQASERRQLLDQVISSEPVPPRRLNPAVDRNLEAIILKSLEKLPERRYATAGAFADDLDRFLKGYTVTAKTPSMFERVGKWARREPIKAVLACSIVGLVGVLFMMLGVLYLVQSIGNSQLRTALAETKEAKEKAEGLQAAALDAKDKANAERDRATAEQEKAAALANILGMRVLNKMKPEEDPLQAIKNTREQIQAEKRELQTADAVAAAGLKLSLAENFRVLANLLMLTDPKEKLPEAIAYLGECVKLQEDLGKTIKPLKVDLGLNYIELAGYYAMKGDLEKELETDAKALKVLEDVRKNVSDQPTIRAAIGEAHLMLGSDYIKKGLKKMARKHQKDAVQLLDELVAGAGSDSLASHAYQQKLGRAYQQLANNLDLDDPAEAIDLLEKAEKIFTDKNQYRRNLADVQLNLGQVQSKNKQPERALRSLKSADELVDQMIKDTPASKTLAESLWTLKADIVTAQGTAYEKKGDLVEAEDYHKRSLEVRRKVGVDAVVVNGHSNLGKFYENQKRLPDAIAEMDRALALQEKLVDKAPTNYQLRQVAGYLQYQKAFYLGSLNKWDEAQACCVLAKAQEIEAFIQTRGSPDYSQNLFATFKLMIDMYKLEKRPADAEKVRQERDRLWWRMAEELAKSYQGEGRDAKLPEIIYFFEHALDRDDKLLNVERLKNEPVFEELRNRPEFNKLLR